MFEGVLLISELFTKTNVVIGLVVLLFVLNTLLLLFRPMIVGQIVQSSQSYTYTYTNSSGAQTGTITPQGTLSGAQSDSIFTISLIVLDLVVLFGIVMTVLKMHE